MVDLQDAQLCSC